MTEDVLIPKEDFITAGLDTEGIYRLSVKTMALETRIVQQGDNKGNEYQQIAGQVHLVEHFGGDPAILEYPIREWMNFYLNGNHLKRFRALYVAAYGPPPEAKPGQFSIKDLASALVGNDSVWSTLYWKRNRTDKTIIEQSIGWDFSTDPGTLRAPTPFAQRDAAFAAALKAEAGTTDEFGEAEPVEAFA